MDSKTLIPKYLYFIFISSVVEKYIEEALTDIDDEKNKHSVLAKMVHVENASKKDVFTMISDMFMAGIDTVSNKMFG